MARGGATAALLAAGVFTLAGFALWFALRGGPAPTEPPVTAPPAETTTGSPTERPPSAGHPRGRREPVRTERQPFDAVAMEGRIRGDTGRPVAGVPVVLAGRRTTTDDQGWFRFDAIPPGEHEFLVAMDGHFLHQRKVTIPGSSLDTRLSRVRGMRGVVRDPGGTPLPGFTVRVLRKGQWGKDAITDAEGRFEVAGVRSGSFTVAVSPELSGGTPFLPLWADRVRSSMGRSLDLTMQPGTTITGTIVGPDGRPVEDAHVSAQTKGKDYARAYFHGRSKADGTFLVIVPREQLYHLKITTPTGGEAGFRFLPWKKSDVEARTRQVRVELDPGQAVEGRLVDERGRGVGGQALDLVQLLSGKPYEPRAQARTRDDGSFRFGGVYVLDYVIRLRRGDPAVKTHVLTRGTRVYVGTTDQVVERVAGEGLSGRIVDAEGKPMAKRRLLLRHDGTEFRAEVRTRKDGSFSAPCLAPGSYRVSIYANVEGRWSFHDLRSIRSGATGVELVGTP